MISRRAFIQHSSFALAGAACANSLMTQAAATTGPLGLPIGIQLYTVREETAKDLNGTLQKLASYGYGEVELAGYYGKSAKELRSFLNGFGLTAPSTHQGLTDLLVDTQKKVDFAAELADETFLRRLCASRSSLCRPSSRSASMALARLASTSSRLTTRLSPSEACIRPSMLIA